MQATPGGGAPSDVELFREERAFPSDLDSIKGEVSVGSSDCPCSVSDILLSEALFMTEPDLC